MSKLVVIDDDPIHHFLMRYALHGSNNFDVTTYTMDGSLVLDYIEENKSNPDKLPDIIFLGLNMPKYSGWDFLDHFQQLYNGINKDIKVYVLTSSIQPADRARGAQYSFVRSFINKPLQPEVIREIRPA